MNVKTFLGAAAIALAGTVASMAPANAITTIRDANGQDAGFPFAGTLTLDPTAPLTAGFDSTSPSFNFMGGGSSNVSFDVEATVTSVIEFGNLVAPDDFSKAEVTIGGVVIDLLTNPNAFIAIAVGSPFTVSTNIVSKIGGGSFDFKITAVPLPAAGFLLLGGLGALGGLGFARRRRSPATA